MIKQWHIIVVCLIISACSQSPTTVAKYGAKEGAGTTGIHTVLEGDTIYEVSKRYRLPMQEIVTLNNIAEPYRLRVGYRLKLPPPQEHRVRGDDTIYGIARTYGVSPSRFVTLNNLSPPYVLQEGDILRLPTQIVEEIHDNVLYEPDTYIRGVVSEETISTAQVSSVESTTLSPPSSSSKTTQTHYGQSQIKGANAATPNHKPKRQKASISSKATNLRKTPERSGQGKFLRPVDGNLISSYGPKANGLHNDGINIKVPKGTPVRAAENGVVVYTGDDLKGYGNLVLVRHEDQYMSAYAHLDKTLIQKGDIVKRGQSIATVGSSGQVDSPQLHFEIRKGTKALNPQRYL